MALIIRRLQEDDVVQNFNCKDELLNNYLKKHAWTNQQKISIGVTYVAVDGSAPTIVLGYFTLATSAVPRDSFPKKRMRRLPAYDLPLILLARLAVDYRFGGKGLGPQLLRETFRIRFRVAPLVALCSTLPGVACHPTSDAVGGADCLRPRGARWKMAGKAGHPERKFL